MGVGTNEPPSRLLGFFRAAGNDTLDGDGYRIAGYSAATRVASLIGFILFQSFVRLRKEVH